VVIFVLILAKPLSENNQRFRSAKVKVTHCYDIKEQKKRTCSFSVLLRSSKTILEPVTLLKVNSNVLKLYI